MFSPPCKPYSAANLDKGESKGKPLIEQTRDVLTEVGGLYAIENVLGAASRMAKNSTLLRGEWFGLNVDRARLFETNFVMHVDAALKVPGEMLRARCCLGVRRRFRRMDPFGRPVMTDCCHGNLFALQGDRPLYATLEECSQAMGVDLGHMPYKELAQAIPPDYAALVFGQMCMRRAQEEFGAPAITYDEMISSPAESKRKLALWLRGAGAPSPAIGLTLSKARVDVRDKPGEGPLDLLGTEPEQVRQEGEPTAVSTAPPFVSEEEFRELYYTRAGGYDRVVSDAGEPPWMDQLRPDSIAHGQSGMDAASMQGVNTLVYSACGKLTEWAVQCARAATSAEDVRAGTRVTVVVGGKMRSELEASGFSYVREVLTSVGRRHALTIGTRRWCAKEQRMDHEMLRAHMDPKDVGLEEDDLDLKRAMVWSWIQHDPDRWRGKELPPLVEELMTSGAVVPSPPGPPAYAEIPQYAWDTDDALAAGIMEADRALVVGFMEYVPEQDVEAALTDGYTHPWTMDLKGTKWRACHDYKKGANRYMVPPSFGLPTVWDVASSIKPGAYMAKFDLRDGFWHCPVSKESRRRLMMRHPGTGRLMWPNRLPFGYVDSPRLFCAMTESIAQRFRERVAGKGVQVWCFVDDFLVAGDSLEITQWAIAEFKALLGEFELCWAPHKHRGPAQCMEFLGLLISNVEGHRRVGLSLKRTKKLRGMIDEWMGRRPVGARELSAEPREVAKLLGHLVFASQCVPQGRAYMQSMLSSFAGLQIDWVRGMVQMPSGKYSLLHLRQTFWNDLEWWSAHLESRNSVMIGKPPTAEAVVAGTDASNFGCGELVWLNGQRAEVMLRFTHAEVRRPINWRELLGIVRVVEVWGAELKGKRLLIETDNMAAKCSAAKGSSKAEDMQELVRRLVEECERWDIDLKLTHTPGVMLHRPDATSRGDPVEEPRQRLNRACFDRLQSRFGPFDEMVGAERDHARVGERRARLSQVGAEGAQLGANTHQLDAGGTKVDAKGTGVDAKGARLWLHPTHATVGSAMRLIGERMSAIGIHERGTMVQDVGVSGLMVVPRAPEAAWWSMMKYFDVVGELGADEGCLEANCLGSWTPIGGRRSMLVLRFPRLSGGNARRVGVRGGASPGPDYVQSQGSDWWLLPILKGAVLYSPSGLDEPGGLVRVDDDLVDEDGSGDPLVSCVLMLRSTKRWQTLHAGDPGDTYEFDPTLRAPSYKRVRAGEFMAWGYEPDTLWEVPGTVHVLDTKSRAEVELTKLGGGVYGFDWRMAEEDIRKQGNASLELSSAEGDDLRDRARLWLDDCPAESMDEDDQPAERPVVQQESEQRALVALRPPRAEQVDEGLAPGPAPPAALNRYSGVCCMGCGEPFRRYEPMSLWRAGYVHPSSACRSLAEATRDKAPVVEAPQVTQVGSSLRKLQLEEKYTPERIERLSLCMEGRCKNTLQREVKCSRACGRGVHASCAQISFGHAKLANLVCLPCRLADRGLTSAPKERTHTMMVTLLMDLTTGAASTAYGYGEYSRIEAEFVEGFGQVAGRGGANGSLLMPRHNASAFKDMLTWLVLSSGRGLSLDTFVRTAGAFFTITSLPDWTKQASVKAHVKELKVAHGLESQPATHGTRRMLRLLMEKILPAWKTSDIIRARSMLFLALEAVGGLRVGEALGAGDHHGIYANNMCILRDTRDGSVSVEGRLEHSKTKNPRWINMVGVTETSRVQVAGLLADYWKQCGIETTTRVEGVYEETRPDYWVVRVSLLGGSTDHLSHLGKVLRNSSVRNVRALASNSILRATQRSSLKHDTEEKAYINVAGGKWNSPELRQVMLELRGAGLGRWSRLAMGPLIRASAGSKVGLNHMPLSPDSTYAILKEAMGMAYEQANSSESGPDPELDLMGALKPSWSNHSWRRFADKVARETRQTTGVSEVDIDLFFGWMEAFYQKLMQLHYAGRGDRVKRARVTMMV